MKEPSSAQSHKRIFPFSLPAAIVFLIVLGFAAYVNAVAHPFVHDDIVFILQNPYIARWDNIGDSFLNPSIPQSFEGLVTPYYRPVLEVFYRLQYAVFGFNPYGFHLFNIVVHVINGLLLFGILRRILKGDGAAFLIAAIFIVHPVQTQAVACVAGISNVLCAFFILASFYCYVIGSAATQRKPLWFITSVILFISALFTKEQAVFAFALFICYEWFLGRSDEGLVVRLYRLAVLGVSAAGYLACRQTLFGSLTSTVFENIGELKLRLLAIPSLIETFIGILLVPVGLHYYRSLDILAPFVVPFVLLIMLTVLTAAVLLKLPIEERRRAGFGLAWFFLLLVPVSNIVPLVNEYSFVAASEHGLYLPMVGLMIFIVTVVSCRCQGVLGRYPERVRTGLAILLIVLTVMTIRQNTYWRGEIPLFERALTFEPQLGRVHVLLAKAYLFNGRVDDALAEFEQAELIMRNYAVKAVGSSARRFYQGTLKSIYADIAQCYVAKRDARRAMEYYNRALTIDPNDDLVYTNRALVFIQTGRMPEGILDLQTALRINPGNLMAANNLSICLIQQGDHEGARTILQGILARDPGFQAARDNLRRLNEAPR